MLCVVSLGATLIRLLLSCGLLAAGACATALPETRKKVSVCSAALIPRPNHHLCRAQYLLQHQIHDTFFLEMWKMDALANVMNTFRHWKKLPATAARWEITILQAVGALWRKPWSVLKSSNHLWSYIRMTVCTCKFLVSCNSQWRPETRFGNWDWLVPEHPSCMWERRAGVSPSARGSLQPARGASSYPSLHAKQAMLKGASSVGRLSIDNIYLVQMERETTCGAFYKVCFV